MIADFSDREKVCFDFLNQIPKDRKYVVIGGYAIASFGFPRFSVDLDITIPEAELSFFKKLIIDNGFILTTVKEDLSYSGRFESRGGHRDIETPRFGDNIILSVLKGRIIIIFLVC